jgi:1-deoxy-D-xylulose 5-phosphate reductoisomerase
VAVAALLREEIRFMEMPKLVAATMEATSFLPQVTLEDLVATNSEAQAKAREILTAIKAH